MAKVTSRLTVRLKARDGTPGATGPQGPPGADGQSVDAEWDGTKLIIKRGNTVLPGVDLLGPVGLTGKTGAKGDKGDTGATGATGAKGDKGDTGATGAKGADGQSVDAEWSGTKLIIKRGTTVLPGVELTGATGAAG